MRLCGAPLNCGAGACLRTRLRAIIDARALSGQPSVYRTLCTRDYSVMRGVWETVRRCLRGESLTVIESCCFAVCFGRSFGTSIRRPISALVVHRPHIRLTNDWADFNVTWIHDIFSVGANNTLWR
jgi:hypothetical protein